MNSATVSGPVARIRRAMRSASAVTGAAGSGCRRGLSARALDQPHAENQHGDRQQLTHGETPHEISELTVRLSEKLRDDARDGVARKEYAREIAAVIAGAGQALQHEQHEEKHDTLERSLIELAGVARQSSLVRGE